MIEKNELVALLLATGALIFLILQREHVKKIRAASLLTLSFYLLYAGYVFTVLEGLVWYDLCNVLEHLCNNLGIVALVAWIWRVSGKDGLAPW